MASKRWMFYAINGVGMGHLARLLALARGLRQRRPSDEILFLTTSEAAGVLWPEGFASVKLPSPTAMQLGGLPESVHASLQTTLIPAAIAAFGPDAIVVDTFPGGAHQELVPILNWDVRRIFVYREQRPQVCRHPAFQAMLQRYDRVVVPHPKDQAEIALPQGMQADWVGHMMLRSRDEGLERDDARRRLGLPLDREVIYIGFGGGGFNTHDTMLEWALRVAAEFDQYHFAYPVPPLARSVVAPPDVPNVSCFRYFPLAECWSAFDGAISGVGYNTCAELLHHGVPTIWVPVAANVDDQVQRADRMVRAGAGWTAAKDDDDALRQALRRFDDAPRRSRIAAKAREIAPENGASRGAEILEMAVG